MKKIGLVGGLAWLSTIEYYSEIHRAVETQFTNTAYLERQSSLEMSIESLDLKTALSYLGSEGDESTWSSSIRTIATRYFGCSRVVQSALQ
jgi:aspartate/glutamate racemase